MNEFIEPLREAVNFEDFVEREKLVSRRVAMRADAVLQKNTIEYYNRAHPNETPLSTAFEDKVIAWLDGKGPQPTRQTCMERCSPTVARARSEQHVRVSGCRRQHGDDSE